MGEPPSAEKANFDKAVVSGLAAVSTEGALPAVADQLAVAGDAPVQAQSIFDAATSGSAQAAPGGGTGRGGNININACYNYVMNGDFLLDTRLGRVWKYDDSEKVFVRINKESTQIEAAVMSSALNSVQSQLNSAYNALNAAEQAEVKEVYAMNTKAMAQHLTVLGR